jgi:hypothetical protein
MRVPVVAITFLLVSPAVGNAWDPIKDLTGKRLDQHLNHGRKELERLPGSVQRCVKDPFKCTRDQIDRLMYTALWPVIERYKNHLFNQAEGRWKSLPQWLVDGVQRYYPEINLDSVRYAENINTIHNQAITWHYHIFFPINVNFYSTQDVLWMLHELEHVVQYQRRGGEQAFLSEYIWKTPGKIIETGSFNVHDAIDIERAAHAKANNVIGAALQARDGFHTQTGSTNHFPPAARFCVTPFVTCGMAVRIAPGMQCFFPTPQGQVWGRAN